MFEFSKGLLLAAVPFDGKALDSSISRQAAEKDPFSLLGASPQGFAPRTMGCLLELYRNLIRPRISKSEF